ncbi:GNAT family N-acetyltransferase [Lysobacter niastensis]|uniref:N-acetyltransferase n=1 Tax=Lysobacter niastensis TaxID=380629 RepID=A0ABS0B5J8_9GAMM|nr:N-acetyltransferase [Lysobacter niastensis]MBF6024148.1 N-acetyltransferase [Lysobacter niastensis]
MWIRTETEADHAAIRDVIGAAFAGQPGDGGPEQRIVDALREAQALSLSLVADIDGRIAGHIAFSPVTLSPATTGQWYGLAPIAVLPRDQRHGVGKALVRAGLTELERMRAAGCVVLGEPGFYQQFGFRAGEGARLANVPPEYFMALALGGTIPDGEVRYHTAFGLT